MSGNHDDRLVLICQWYVVPKPSGRSKAFDCSYDVDLYVGLRVSA